MSTDSPSATVQLPTEPRLKRVKELVDYLNTDEDLQEIDELLDETIGPGSVDLAGEVLGDYEDKIENGRVKQITADYNLHEQKYHLTIEMVTLGEDLNHE